MKMKKNGACLIVLLAVMLVLIATTPVAMAIPGQLRLDAISGTPVGEYGDAWLSEGTIIDDTQFDLTITNYNGADIHHLYLLVAVDRDPEGIVTVVVDDISISSFSDDNITKSGKALVTETEPDYEYPGHGIYNTGNTHFEVVEITIEGDDDHDSILENGETITVHVEIDITPNNAVKVHFDAVGADSDNHPIAFVPPSHDVTHVPEFTTIAIPVAAILGLFFFFNRRKRRKE